MIRALIRRIVDTAADRGKYHLAVIFADGSAHHTTHVGEPDVTIVFRTRRGEQDFRARLNRRGPVWRRSRTWRRKGLDWIRNPDGSVHGEPCRS